MSFAQPLAWYLLLLAIPIILFYILKIRLRQEPVSTTIFWQQVFEERRTRSFWRRLRHLVSLLLSLLFLGILIGAVLDPVPSWQAKPVRCVIVVDNSAGMNALTGPGKPSRLDVAKTELHRLLETLEIGRQTAILTAGGPPRIVVGFTDHQGTLRRAVDSIPKTDYPTSLREAVELAGQLVASEENSIVLVYTDGCSVDLAELEKLPNVHFFPVGDPIDNLAITRFQPRRSLGDAVGYEVLAEVVNFGEKPVQARLEVELEERTVDVIPMTLEPNQPQTTIVRDTTSQGGLLRATLQATDKTAEDLFATDNTAYAFLPERPTQHVYLYGEEDFFLLKVLQSQPNVELHRVAEGAGVPAKIPEGGVLVVHQTVPETIPAGKVLVIDPRNGCNRFDVGDALEMPIVAKEESDSPLMKFVHLINLTIRGARSLALNTPADWTVLAETPETSPIYAASTASDSTGDDSEVLVLTADLKQGDLALRTAFPIMVSQALIRFRGSGGELEQAYSTSQPVRLPLRTPQTQVLLRSPSGQETIFPVKSGSVSLGTLPECGVWTVHEGSDSPTELARIACNLADSTESNLRLAPETFYRQTPDATVLRSGTRPFWFHLALLALVFTSVEWFLYQRRWID